MSTLTSPPLSTLLDRLFEESTTADAALRAELGQLSPDARAAFMASATTDYRAFYGRAKGNYLAVSRETGVLLYMLARASNVRTVVEFGTSFGVSTLYLAAAVKDNGGGRVIGTELEPSKAERARANLATAGLGELADIREGDALESLARDLPETIDMILLDGAKALYPRVLAMLEPRLTRGAWVVADNADDSPELLARVRSSDAYLSVPFGGDVEVSQLIEPEALKTAR